MYFFICSVIVKLVFWPLGGTASENEVLFMLTLLVSCGWAGAGG